MRSFAGRGIVALKDFEGQEFFRLLALMVGAVAR